MRGIAFARTDDEVAQELRVIEVSPELLAAETSRLALRETLRPSGYNGESQKGGLKIPPGIGLPTLTELKAHHAQLQDLLAVELDVMD